MLRGPFDGERQGVHYWNRLAGGTDIDLPRKLLLAVRITGAGPGATVP